MSKAIIVDIETCPLSEAELAPFMPQFEAPSNYKDAAKIAAAIEEKKKAWLDGCALDALTARVLAIGLMIDSQFVLISEPATEATMIHEFFDAIQAGPCGQLHHIVGFNICQFDLPMLIRRAWRLGVQVPLGLRRGRYWGDNITDLRDVWQMGDRQAHGSLDTIAKHLGVGAKTGNGKDFAALWRTDRMAAEGYLRTDLSLTAAIAKKLGVLD